MEGKNDITTSRRARADFRIQRKDDFAKIIKENDYIHHSRAESSNFRRMLHKKTGKQVGMSVGNWGAEELQAINKGYPENFTNYFTYDSERERNYKKFIRKKYGAS